MKSRNHRIANNFYILPEFREQYSNQIRLGLELLSESNIGILGLCRDIEKTVGNMFDLLDDIEETTSSFRCFFYENDSSDSTKEILSERKKTRNNFYKWI